MAVSEWFFDMASDLPEVHIHMQSRNLPLTDHKPGRSQGSECCDEKEPVLWVSGGFYVWYVRLFVPIFKPCLFPMQIVRTLVLVFAVLFSEWILYSKCKNRRMLPACFQDVAKVGRGSLALYVVFWLVCMSSRLRMMFSLPYILRMWDQHCC